MTKIKFYLLFAAFVVLSACQSGAKTNNATISGDFSFKPRKEVITLYSVEDGQRKKCATASVNENGQFGFIVPVLEPGFYYIDYGQTNVQIKGQLLRFYLEPGLDLTLAIDKDNYTLTGKNVGHNHLVQKANKIADQFAPFTKLGGMITYEDFFPFLDNKGVKMVRDFKKTIHTEDQAFNDLLKLAVSTDFKYALYTFFRLPRTKFPKKDNRPAIYKELKKAGVNFSNPNLLKLANGLGLIKNCIFYYNMRSGAFKKPLTEIMTDNLNYISNDQLKEVYVRNKIKTGSFNVAEYTAIIGPLRQYLTSEKSKRFILEYEKRLHKEEGQPGYEFTYNNIKGEPVSFSDFKGKYVYIDVWATWCGPCRKEIPFLMKLEHEYKGEDIVFISLSLDKPEDKQKWIDFVKEKKLTGVQLMADKAFKSGIAINYEINAIPRFLLFDKEGKIISTDALRPSNKLIRKRLDDLLK